MKNVKHAVATMMLVAMTALTLDAFAGDKSKSGAQVNLNSATAAELSYLPGIGQSKAEAIIKYRTKRPFKKVEDLMRVKGIGRKTFKQIRAYLVINGPTTAKSQIKVTT